MMYETMQERRDDFCNWLHECVKDEVTFDYNKQAYIFRTPSSFHIGQVNGYVHNEIVHYLIDNGAPVRHTLFSDASVWMLPEDAHELVNAQPLLGDNASVRCNRLSDLIYYLPKADNVAYKVINGNRHFILTAPCDHTGKFVFRPGTFVYMIDLLVGPDDRFYVTNACVAPSMYYKTA